MTNTSYYTFLGPLLRAFSPERAHGLAVWSLKAGLAPREPVFNPPELSQTIWGLDFPNPIGLAAGFDKNAEVFSALLRRGFGFVEVGTVTPRPQSGNPKPRMFRLPADEAVINRLGFNNRGIDCFAANLKRRPHQAGIVGANIGKNKDSDDAAADYEICAKASSAYADYVVINVSSPNTPGLRRLQHGEQLRSIIDRTHEALQNRPNGQKPPLLVKLAPDLENDAVDAIAATLRASPVQGLVISNTTIARPEALQGKAKTETGGLSGAPLLEPSTRLLSRMYQLTEGKLPIVGVGGVSTGEDAFCKIKAGASLVQLYTALVYHGLPRVTQIKRELLAALQREGFASIQDAIGADHR